MPSDDVEAASSTSVKRLPTNNRRRKVPQDLRKRIAKACSPCNLRRIKCSGDQPCAKCVANSRKCEYPPETEKVVVQKETYEELQSRYRILQQCLADAVPGERNRDALLSKWTKSSLNASAPAKVAPPCPEDGDEGQQTGEGRILQDPDGYTRFLGESSGAAFMDRLREFVATVVPLLSDTQRITSEDMEGMFTSLLGQYHTHDSRPLLLPHVDPFYLPNPEEISKMLTVFRFYAEDGVGAAPCGGIHYWGNLWELEEKVQKILPLSGSRDESIVLCKLNAVLALACQYDPSLALPWETHSGETYFARAKLLLLNPMEDASLAYMCTLSLMGHYLLGLYRRDAAYLYIGLAARIAIIHGLHKGWLINNRGVEGEQHKREFWNTFNQDRWLSCLMGRPDMIPEDAITVELPLDWVDYGLPSSSGLRAHVKLSMVMHEIVSTIYGAANSGLGYSQTISRVDAALEKLSSWRAELPSSLQLQDDENVVDRARLTLHMIYNQLVILCTRPLLFQAVKQVVAAKYISLGPQRQPNPSIVHIKMCADAARSVTALTRQLLSSNQAAFLAAVEYHFPFTAAIVLELARLLPLITRPDDEDSIRLLIDYLQQAGDKGNESAADCRNMVVEFGAIVMRILLDRQTRQSNNSTSGQGAPSSGATGGGLGEAEMNIFRRDLLVSGVQPMSSNGMLLDLGLLGQGQAAAYEELFSWVSNGF